MAQYQLTIDGEILHQLFQRDEGLAKLVEQVLNLILEAQVTEQLQAAPYERTETRQGYRNGYRTRQMKTRIGTLELEEGIANQPGYTSQDLRRYIKKATQGEPQLFEWMAKHKSGRLFWVEVNLKKANIGGQERLLAIVRDITRRKELEEKLKYLSSCLLLGW